MSDEPKFDGDEERSDEELARQAQVLVSEAKEEARSSGLTRERFDALKSEIELLALESSDPEEIRELVAEPLARLEPGGKFEDLDD
jgi:hypothetical protein